MATKTERQRNREQKLEYIKRTVELQSLVESFKLDYIDVDSTFDISDLEQILSVIYLPASLQQHFKKFANNKIKLFKIVNFGSAAIRIRYNVKHQYSIEEYTSGDYKKKSDKTIDDLKAWRLSLINQLDKIETELEESEESEELISIVEHSQEMKEDIKYLDKVLANFDKYEIIQSSFLKNYTYTMCNYQYVDAKDKKHFRSVQLVGSESTYYNEKFKKEGKKQKINIIFLDAYKIKNKTHKTTEKVRAYLKSFDKKIKGARRDLFIKKKITVI